MKKLLVVFAVLAFSFSASATLIPRQNVTVDLDNSRVNVSMRVKDMTSSGFYYTSSYPVKGDVEASVGNESLDCNSKMLPPGSYITCDTTRENFTIHFSYLAEGLTSQRSGVKIFRYTQSIQRPTEEFMLRVYLPRGSGLVDGSNVSLPVISPDSGLSGTDGRRIYVEWASSPDLGQASFQALYRPVSGDASGDGPSLMWVVPLGVFALLIGGGVFIVLKSRRDIEEAYEDLSEDEKDVLDMIRENENSMLQKDIVDQSEYSKAKISSVISGLEDNGIVKKSKEGRSNKVSISRKYTI
ncbi:MAG: helix-turn-helix transcriptional regulator [Candidatus Nanohalobium sp.]